jgi:hypothetical protein
MFSHNSDNESLDHDSDVPTTNLSKQLWSSAVVSSDSETSTEEEENCEPKSSDDETSDVRCKTDLKKNKHWAFPWNHRSKYSNW